MDSIIARASLSTAEYSISDFDMVRDRNVAGLPLWLKIAAIAILESSHSIWKGSSSYMQLRHALHKSFFKILIEFNWVSCKGNEYFRAEVWFYRRMKESIQNNTQTSPRNAWDSWHREGRHVHQRFQVIRIRSNFVMRDQEPEKRQFRNWINALIFVESKWRWFRSRKEGS